MRDFLLSIVGYLEVLRLEVAHRVAVRVGGDNVHRHDVRFDLQCVAGLLGLR